MGLSENSPPCACIRRILRDRVGVCVVFTIFAVHWVHVSFFPERRNINIRIGAIYEDAWNIARGESEMVPIRGDPQGIAYLLAAFHWLTTSSEERAKESPPEYPKLFYAFLYGLNAFMFSVLFLATRKLLGQGIAIAITLLYVASGNLPYILLAGDVYLFPLYAGILMMTSLSVIDGRSRRSTMVLALCVVGIALCEQFRNASWLVCLGFLLAALRPQWIASSGRERAVRWKAIGCLLGVLVLVQVENAILPNSRKAKWHVFHVGLLEFGGHRDRHARIYPFFVPQEDLPPESEQVAGHSDYYTEKFVESMDPSARMSSTRDAADRYEAIAREDFLRIARTYPAGMAALLGRRAWRLLVLNPWQAHARYSYKIPGDFDLAIRIGWIVLFGAGIALGIPKRGQLVCLGLSALALPPLLVISGYTMYNFPGELSLYLLGALSFQAIVVRFSRKRHAEILTSSIGL